VVSTQSTTRYKVQVFFFFFFFVIYYFFIGKRATKVDTEREETKKIQPIDTMDAM
jgi:preprotein translocase subunit YajC